MSTMFQGRTIAVVNDLSTDEQAYLYEKTRELKEAILSRGDLSRFRIDRPELGLYLFFMEDSTRTKESFRNAAKFHSLKLNNFDAQNSSFNKQESITDTIRMLCGYSDSSIFVIRSKLEGVCRWLETALGAYADRIGIPAPAFINAGDGRHEHPTQEFLDEFTFLEKSNWSRDHLHVALVGDLFHGRTVHSKADGLRVFRNVEFGSIREYLSQRRVASSWYFTRLQLERMGDRILEKAESLREAVTFAREFIPLLPEGARFFHPLPRHRVTPTIPQFLDSTPLNGWDEQSRNGYYTRIVEIALVGGALGEDFEGEPKRSVQYADDFVQEAPVRAGGKPREYKVGIKPVETGIVIDHIGRGMDIPSIWSHIDKIRRILNLNTVSSHGVFESKRNGLYKGIISLPGVQEFDQRQIKMLAAISPGCTVNIVTGATVRRKYRLEMPPRIYGFREISCKNETCVSHPQHHEHAVPEFYRSADSRFVCRYCETGHDFREIWDV
jgi:aspartate carbamoyltransferase